MFPEITILLPAPQEWNNATVKQNQSKNEFIMCSSPFNSLTGKAKQINSPYGFLIL